VRDLTEVYLTLGFKEIASKANTEENKVESEITAMAREGIVQARVNRKQQIVDFIETDHHGSGFTLNSNTLQLINTLEKQNARIASLANKAARMDTRIKLSENFQLK